METLVVGAGAMGRWIGQVLTEHDPATQLAFADADDATAQAAAQALDARVETDDETSYDLLCIAVPIPAATSVIADHGSRAREAIIDVTGTMAAPLAAMADHAPGRAQASLHPLFAPENEPGNVPVVVAEPGPTVETVMDALAARGNNVFETTAQEHDEAMETVQARTHAAVLAFALASEDVDDQFHTPISSTLTELAGQVTGGDSRVYADIQAAFDGAEDVATAARRLAEADPETFAELYAAAGECINYPDGDPTSQ